MENLESSQTGKAPRLHRGAGEERESGGQIGGDMEEKGKDKEFITTIRMPEELHELLRVIAFKTKKSINQIMVESIKMANPQETVHE